MAARSELRRIIRLFRPYRARLALVGALVGLSSLVGLASPFMLRAVLDDALPHGRTELLALLALGMIAVAALTSVFGVWQTYLSTTVGQRVMHDLRTAVYARLQSMPLAFFTATRTGEVQSRLAHDIGGMQSTVTSTATSLIANFTSVLAAVVAMFALDWRLTLISLAMLPFFVWISRRVGAERRRITAQRQRQLAAMSAVVEESLSVSGILLGRTMGRAPALVDDFDRESRSLVDLEIRAGMAGRWRQSTITIVMAAMPAVVYWAAGLTAAAGTPLVSIGTLVAFTTLQAGLLRPAVMLLSTGVQVQSSLALFTRIFEYLDLRPDITEPERPVPLPVAGVTGAVRFERVGFGYDADREVLRDIDIDVPAGSGLAIVGETGSGKTTLGYLVARLYDATSGRVTIDGIDVRELSFADLAAAVGVVSQETYLFHATVAENLRFAKPDATDEELRVAARAARIHDHIASLPQGYDTLVGERGYRFSGGEKQRLAVARAILRNPPILVLDEATSALDTRTEREVQDAIDALSAGRTTITIAHRLSTIRDADQIVVLDRGRVVERGTHEELLARGTAYADLLTRDGVLAPGMTVRPGTASLPNPASPPGAGSAAHARSVRDAESVGDAGSVGDAESVAGAASTDHPALVR
ncbi:Putative multidrug export ATP-binding/permease protein SAV1866 [Nocardia otitidiscaviarum]|uniref:Fatty acid ABC transporter ATP-binding/permease protein n=1 Tax=Nocardia otitidiscaviarum TaxID=1823 RepID=A0A379JJQ3_9NOCA|nr:ABC transporter ATP-binding protein [Nocardia otitidiscaviarum]SUD48812.1 Putative multidrug export ATP-binding/permease protein SAV1866 [Nocardia otitidiscaviarum]